MRDVSACEYREEVRGEGKDEEAHCRLVERLSDPIGAGPCGVGRAMCETCCRHPAPSPTMLNPVVASLLFTRASTVLNRDGLAPDLAEKAKAIRQSAEQGLLRIGTVFSGESSVKNAGPCFHLGGQTGLRDCPTCDGSVRVKVFTCQHPLHQETTLRECETCPDFDARLQRKRVATWALGVTSAPRSLPTLDRCLRSLAAAGWELPRLFVEPGTVVPDGFAHLPISRRSETLGEWPNWFLSLAELVHRSPDADAYMMVQDDTIFCRNTRAFLEAELWPGPRVGIVSVYCPEPYTQADDGWALIDTGHGMFGALTCIFPNAAARALLADPRVVNQRQRGAFKGLVDTDGVLGRWANRAGMPVFCHSPSLAQHIGETSTVWQDAENSGVRHSINFLGEDFDALRLLAAETARKARPIATAGAPPLVSCIMPTGDRRGFARLALRHFLDQDYPNKELIVVDDGSDPIVDLVAGLPEVRYLRLANRLSLGAKRNLACREARGEIIAHWDDDDWQAPHRLSYQVAPLVSREFEVSGLRRTFVLELPDAVWRMFEGEIHLGTLVYHRSLLDAGLSYPDLDVGEDASWLGQAVARGHRLARLDNPSVYVYVRHGRNAWKVDPGGWARVDPPPAFSRDALSAIRDAASDLARPIETDRISTDTDVDRLVDCLGRTEIQRPPEPIRVERCIATVVSPGYTVLLEDMLGSLQANGGCPDAWVVVFAVNPDADCRRVAERHGATLIPCLSRSVVNSTLKALLYSAARVIDAEKFVCLDADMLVLGDLGPVFAALDACAKGSILAVRDGNRATFPNLDAAFLANYGGRPEDLAVHFPGSIGSGSYPLVVNDGLFAASRLALLALDETVRGWSKAADWVDDRQDIPWRNQYVFNRALAYLECGVELDPIYNVQLDTEDVDWDVDQGRTTAFWRGRPARVLHFDGRGRAKAPPIRRCLRRARRPLAEESRDADCRRTDTRTDSRRLPRPDPRDRWRRPRQEVLGRTDPEKTLGIPGHGRDRPPGPPRPSGGRHRHPPRPDRTALHPHHRRGEPERTLPGTQRDRIIR